MGYRDPGEYVTVPRAQRQQTAQHGPHAPAATASSATGTMVAGRSRSAPTRDAAARALGSGTRLVVGAEYSLNTGVVEFSQKELLAALH